MLERNILEGSKTGGRMDNIRRPAGEDDDLDWSGSSEMKRNCL